MFALYPQPSSRLDLRTDDTISGQIRPPMEGERYFALIKVDALNFEPPRTYRVPDVCGHKDSAPRQRIPHTPLFCYRNSFAGRPHEPHAQKN